MLMLCKELTIRKEKDVGYFKQLSQYSHKIPAIDHDKPKREQQAPRRNSNELHTNLPL